ncbi:hypothetical protein DFH06DRAFT_1299593 [Mycena polygramma]|nr:hypothetical protein DFH06DRAFT_1299593 [Mycena polygramma]
MKVERRRASGAGEYLWIPADLRDPQQLFALNRGPNSDSDSDSESDADIAQTLNTRLTLEHETTRYSFPAPSQPAAGPSGVRQNTAMPGCVRLDSVSTVRATVGSLGSSSTPRMRCSRVCFIPCGPDKKVYNTNSALRFGNRVWIKAARDRVSAPSVTLTMLGRAGAVLRPSFNLHPPFPFFSSLSLSASGSASALVASQSAHSRPGRGTGLRTEVRASSGVASTATAPPNQGKLGKKFYNVWATCAETALGSSMHTRRSTAAGVGKSPALTYCYQGHYQRDCTTELKRRRSREEAVPLPNDIRLDTDPAVAVRPPSRMASIVWNPISTPQPLRPGGTSQPTLSEVRQRLEKLK